MEQDVIFIDWSPTIRKCDIYGGGQIRRYYAWTTINKVAKKVLPFRKKNGRINWRSIVAALKKDHILWVEYGCGGFAHLFAIIISYIRVKKLILNVHDFTFQQNDYDKDPWFIKKIRLRIIEKILLHRANVIILAWPRLLDYFTPNENQKIIVMPPGVGEDELLPPTPPKNEGTKVALYFGSMRRKGIIPMIMKLFAELSNWELDLVGPEEGEKIVEYSNVKYFGSLNHDKLANIICNSNVILIPLFSNDYSDKVMPIKIGYVLNSCRPIITTKLSGISEYISMVDLEENVIYIDAWSVDSLKKALIVAENININIDETIEKLRPMAWEPRFKKVVEIAFDTSHIHNQVEII